MGQSFYGSIAQQVEQSAVNRCVVGSSPTISAIKYLSARGHPSSWLCRQRDEQLATLEVTLKNSAMLPWPSSSVG